MQLVTRCRVLRQQRPELFDHLLWDQLVLSAEHRAHRRIELRHMVAGCQRHLGDRSPGPRAGVERHDGPEAVRLGRQHHAVAPTDRKAHHGNPISIDVGQVSQPGEGHGQIRELTPIVELGQPGHGVLAPAQHRRRAVGGEGVERQCHVPRRSEASGGGHGAIAKTVDLGQDQDGRPPTSACGASAGRREQHAGEVAVDTWDIHLTIANALLTHERAPYPGRRKRGRRNGAGATGPAQRNGGCTRGRGRGGAGKCRQTRPVRPGNGPTDANTGSVSAPWTTLTRRVLRDRRDPLDRRIRWHPLPRRHRRDRRDPRRRLAHLNSLLRGAPFCLPSPSASGYRRTT